jgi:hypothetical protein
VTSPTNRAELLRLMADAIEEHMLAPHELPLDADLHAKYLDNAAGVLRAIEAAGCAVVPSEPTQDQWLAGEKPVTTRSIYTAMLAAGPFREG